MDSRLEEYIAYLGAVRGLSPRTLRSYREDFESFERHLAPGAQDEARSGSQNEARSGSQNEARSGSQNEARSGSLDLDSLGARDIRAFAAELVTEGKAGSSVNRALSALRGYFRYRVRFGGIAVDPTADVEGMPSKRPLPKFLFEEETAAFLDLPKGEGFGPARDRAILEFLYSTGCRVAEAANVTLDRLDLQGGSARVMGKGSKERVVFLAPTAKKALGAYLPLRKERVGRASAADVGEAGKARPRLEYLFVNARGGRLTERGIEWIMQGYSERSGMNRSVSPHAFRHSFATHLVGRGADIRAVQELLGHASVSTTQVYAHVDMERLRKVYEQAHPHAAKRRGDEETAPHGGRKQGL